jgi:DNA repair exonuclease SbcCD ATPase subunit/DNA repair exonuclease SbcCD nuclease subunit
MNNVIPVKFNRLSKIIQIADIHIRLFKRHKEYRAAFENLYDNLKISNLDETVIAVCGDIIHTKCENSPEMIQLTSEFLSSLADLAPTIVILGNHDLNLANTDRLDSLTPIIQNLRHPQLHYLRESGVYRCANVDFAVMSLIGDESEWPTPSNCTADTKIALYHGPVHNAQTDVGYVVSNKSITVDTFDGFDIVLLGDIHRHQVLQDKNPIIVYASSLIQQNHGETTKGHGWCEWDISKRTFVFHELENDYGYYTLRIEKGVVPDYAEMPKNVRLRIFAGNLDQSELKELVTTIRKQHNVVELAITHYEGARRTGRLQTGNTLLDIHDVNTQNKLITDYIKEAFPNIEDDTLQSVHDLNSRLNGEVSSEDLARKITWKPLSLEFDNLFTYGEGNYIDFTKINGVAGIFAPNASGKTSVAEAICFALYDRTPRTNKAASIMNYRKTECYLKFRFDINGTEFVIERKGKKNKKGEVKIDVDFYKMEKGVKVSLNGEERRYTNQEIRKYVGDFEDFILTTLSSSAQTGLFVDRGQSDRKDTLSQFMGLTIFDKLHLLANEESKEIAIKLKQFKKDDFTQALADVDSNITRLTDNIRDCRSQLDYCEKNVELINVRIQELLEQKNPNLKNINHPDLYSATPISERREILRDQLVGMRSALEILQGQITKGQTKLSTEYSTVEEDYSAYVRCVSDRLQAKRLLDGINRELAQLKSQLSDLDKHEYNENCELCLKNAKHTIEKKTLLSKNLAEAIPEQLIHESQYDDLVKKCESFENIEEKHNKYLTGKNWLASSLLKERDQKLSIEKMEREIDKHTEELAKLSREIDEYNSNLDAIKSNQSIDEDIKSATSLKKAFTNDVYISRLGLDGSQRELAITEQKKQDMLDRITEAKALEGQYKVYEAYLAAVCRDGLPYKMIADVLPDIEVAVNNILSQMVEFTLQFDTDGKNVNMRLSYDEDRTWPLELASGMEKFLSGLAIRVALMTVSTLPKSTCLILDEGFGTLDSDNRSSIFGLFDVLRTQFDTIFLISHVDSVKDVADRLLEIKRSNGFSQIIAD